MTYDPEYMRLYRLPDQIERTKEKLARLQAQYRGVKAEVIQRDLQFYDIAFDQMVLTAKKEAAERGESITAGAGDA